MLLPIQPAIQETKVKLVNENREMTVDMSKGEQPLSEKTGGKVQKIRTLLRELFHRILTSLRLDGPDADFPLILDNVFAASVVLIDSGLY